METPGAGCQVVSRAWSSIRTAGSAPAVSTSVPAPAGHVVVTVVVARFHGASPRHAGIASRF
jgi:hypothetical protein